LRAPDGRDVRVPDWIGLGKQTLGVGQRVIVLYDPDEPENAMIDHGWKNWLLRIPGVFGVRVPQCCLRAAVTS
jgi:uncharacterized protein DUF3592